jgi:4-amino-4-deoxy-L-arabinose transferase-like glycosyltransferase
MVLRFVAAHELLLLVLLIAIFGRLAVFALFPSTFAFDQTGVIHGSSAYDAYARNLLATGVYGKVAPGVADGHLPPLYSYALAGVYGLFGRSAPAVALVHIALDCVSIAALYHLCKRLFPHGEWVGVLSGLFFALYPYLIFQNLTLIDTPLYMALLFVFLLLAALLREQPAMDGRGWLLGSLAGLVLGLAALTRPNVLLLTPLVGVWFLFRRPLASSLLRLLPVAAMSALALLPWIARNYGIYGRFVPVALNSGENFYQGNSVFTIPYLTAGYDVQWVPPPDVGEAEPLTPEANAALMNAGLAFLRENPGAIPELWWVKFLNYWSMDITPLRNPGEGELPRVDYQGNVIAGTDNSGGLTLGELPPGDPVAAYSGDTFAAGRVIHRWYYGALFVLALIGSALALPRWRDVSLLWLVQIAMTANYVLFHPSTRYRAPTDPLLFAFSAYALVWLWAYARARRGRAVTERVQNAA